ncbi:MAG: hypothetical protein HQK78_06000, partial [Desulfobacterales bacterium]|nr:hypothetical protein [Desulfobacterales bacterium]
MKKYTILLNKKTYDKSMLYLEYLVSGRISGKYLQKKLHDKDISKLTLYEFIELLMSTKRPQIFAESSVAGEGSDWNQEELSILGDIGIAAPVKVYDNGKHFKPDVYEHPLNATLLFTPGALLRNGRNNIPADWNEVTRTGNINSEGYYGLYERRLLPLFMYANQIAKQKDTRAFITIPGLGCGQFAGKFMRQLGSELKKVLINFLNKHGSDFSNIDAVYYDPYQECDNERYEINAISFLVRPLAKGNENKPQLCHPKTYEEKGDCFANCE